eukprot:CAMPEP_0175059372 /NCGR_PEP_ID=MMETSP0052_2-20121109/12397_1 /TAXON_ID=51329 ORGANISM="Polytomella parva, Strain SAG 63-3" /NCGR_SAMPLE_ID=MMETSP0052_2 /ASSEMBLY_ACC=CAM_ASM_000194 /LENGTH=236 /DNA_ID=CAMNT_0016324917 /DNA_START=386 /DNA_END=1093 /DNA_ORIENTATION=+
MKDSWKTSDIDVETDHNKDIKSPQMLAYFKCFTDYRHRHKWLINIDPDEFIVLLQPNLPPPFIGSPLASSSSLTFKTPLVDPNAPDLAKFLEPYESYGGLSVYWRLFGSSGVDATPKGQVLRSFRRYVPVDLMTSMMEFHHSPIGFTKAITRTSKWNGLCNPHECLLMPGSIYVNENHEPMGANPWNVTSQKIALFHYQTRSASDFVDRQRRGSGHTQYVLKSQEKAVMEAAMQMT